MCLALVLSTGALAQNSTPPVVVPQNMDTSEGSGSTNIPFGRAVPVRFQAAYDASLFSGPLSISILSFRHDQDFTGSGKRVSLEIHAGTLPSMASLQATFAANRGVDFTRVFAQKWVDLPDSLPTSGIGDFAVRIPLDTPLFYDPADGALLLEFVVHEQPRGGYNLDSTYTCASPLQYYGPPGCEPGLEVVSMTEQIVWGNSVVLRVRGAKPAARTLLLFGRQSTGIWDGLNLPFDARPLGAPGCFLATSVEAAQMRIANSLGVADFGFNIPWDVALGSFEVNLQVLSSDYTANALGQVTSQAARVRICGFEAVGRVFANGLQTLVGYRELGVAPVLGIDTN